MKVKEEEKDFTFKMTVDRRSLYFKDAEAWGKAVEELLKDDSQFKGMRSYMNLFGVWRPMCRIKGKKE